MAEAEAGAAAAAAEVAATKNKRKRQSPHLLRPKKKDKAQQLQDKPKLKKGEYYVETLLDKRTYKHWILGEITQYKVKWLGYPMSKCTWEPAWELPPEMIADFNAAPLTSEEEASVSTIAQEMVRMYKCASHMCRNVETYPLEFACCEACFMAMQQQPRPPDAIEPPRYCARECQIRDWQRHKIECPGWNKAIQKLTV